MKKESRQLLLETAQHEIERLSEKAAEGALSEEDAAMLVSYSKIVLAYERVDYLRSKQDGRDKKGPALSRDELIKRANELAKELKK